MSFFAKIVAAGVAFLALLTWMLVRSFSPNEAMGHGILATTSALQLTDSLLLGDVFRARAGILQNYDPLVREVVELRRDTKALDDLDPVDRDQTRQIADILQQQETLLEQFKSANALLQNSLAYFDVLDRKLIAMPSSPAFEVGVASVSSSITHLVHDPEDGSRAAEDALGKLSQLDLPADAQRDVDLLQIHARMLIEQLPRVDSLIRAEQALALARPLQSIERLVDERREVEEEMNRMMRLIFYGACLILSVLLARAIYGIRSRTVALQSMVHRQRIATLASNLFIACPPDDIEINLTRMLELIGAGFGVDRAYILRLDETAQTHIWSREGAVTPSNWPHALKTHMGALRALPSIGVTVPNDPVRVPTGLLRALDAAGIKTWSCIKINREGVFAGVLCLDRSVPLSPTRPAGSMGMTMMGNIVSNALTRQVMYQSRSDLERKLRRAQRLEVIGTFTSGIAHNFNNLINVIEGQADMAADAVAIDSPARGHVGQILRAGARARDLVAKVLAFGRRSDAKDERISVPVLITETLAQARTSHPGVVLEQRLEVAEGAVVVADPAMLQQVFLNIVQNAAQASQDGDLIEVVVGLETTSARRLSHGQIGRGQYVKVLVRDQGSGMSETTLAKLFEPFYTTRSAGTGLGLATARETVVAELGGAFDVTSVMGRGTSLEVWLPAAPPLEASSRAATDIGGGRTVMLLGDRRRLPADEDLLAALGFEPVGFEDPVAAERELRASSDRFDLLIVEHAVRGRSGLDFIRTVRPLLAKGTRVILSTISADSEPRDLAKAGVDALLKQPWQSSALSKVLRG